MKRILITLIPALLIYFAADAQKMGILDFEETSFDFGVFAEDGPMMSYTFYFVNKGKAPVKLETVKAECGCTTPKWTKEEVLPKDTGKVSVIFDPMNRPGKFNKSITVTTNGFPQQVMLYISGNVTPRVKTAKDLYPTELGNLRVLINHINLGEIYTNEEDSVHMAFYNDGEETIVFAEIETPPHLKIHADPKFLPPGEKGRFIIYFDGAKQEDLGFVHEKVMVKTNDKAQPEKELIVMATVKQYFSPLDEEEMANAPKLEFKQDVIDYGNIPLDRTSEVTFEYKNTGKQPLVLYKVKTSCGCTASQPEKEKLEPGESSKLRVTFTPPGKVGYEEKTITVWSNDPLTPQQTLTIKANVVATSAN
ncbi:MAG: DUF1573 domain-containing protein [Bacteroidia bacterium]